MTAPEATKEIVAQSAAGLLPATPRTQSAAAHAEIFAVTFRAIPGK